LAAVSPSKMEVERLFSYFERALPKAGVNILLEKAGITFLLDADTIIISVGEASQNDLAGTLKDQIPEVYTIGDCQKTGNVLTTIQSAYNEAISI